MVAVRHERSVTSLLLLLLCVRSRAINVAIANIRGSTATMYVSGFVRFEQGDDPLGDVTVTINVTGLTTGEHGFHVHQFGDVNSTTDLSSMGAHFVPFCIPPEVAPGGSVTTGGCDQDQVHGLPPSVRRQPGDMGNVLVGGTRTLRTTLTIGQQKMSLTDSLRSIVGRTVVFHSLRDDGTQPYGNAGVPQAYGVIGMAALTGTTNAAMAPTTPKVDKVICTFEGAYPGAPVTHRDVSGFALLQLLEPERPGTVRMQAELLGLERGSTHSFHFHTWGDMTVAYSELGDIYSSNAIHVDRLSVGVLGTAYFQHEFATSSLLQHVGRSLTIHEGPTPLSPTIAAAVCGLANPHAKLDMSAMRGPSADQMAVSGGAVAVVVLTSIIVALFLGTACLYYLRLPIPLCGRWLYAREAMIGWMPQPPPPPPDATTYATDPNKYPPVMRYDHV